MQQLKALWNRSLMGKAIIGLGGFVLLCCVLGLLVPRSQPAPAAGGQPAATSAPAAAAPTTAPAATAGPTNTPLPTQTPAPTQTPKPTLTPSPVPPTPTPIPPVELSGSGQVVTEPFTPPAGINRVILTHQGRSNFIVRTFAASGDEDGLVNEIGNYQGVRPLFSTDAPYFFEVDADGSWTIRVEAMGLEPDAAQGLTGTGDHVSGVFDPARVGAVPYLFMHDGESNFIVHLYCAGGQDSVQNEIGAVNGSSVVRFAKGPCFWEVQADGNWSIQPK